MPTTVSEPSYEDNYSQQSSRAVASNLVNRAVASVVSRLDADDVAVPSPPKRQKSGDKEKSTHETPVKEESAPSPLVGLLGETLLSKVGDVKTSTALAGKTAIGLYFSGHWCGPCRHFTPELGKSYTKHLKAKGCEIVFVSSDRDEASFTSYFKEQADWLALPYAARDVKAALSKKYKVSGIPTLVLLDGATGEVITTDARSDVDADPEGKSFPWKPKTFFEALGNEFLSGADGDTVSLDEVQSRSKVLGLYFSASWCPPCRAFTPQLADAYNSHLREGKGLEVIFCSADRDAAAFRDYFAKQPWLAIPNGDRRVGDLEKVFGVGGYPTLVLVDAQTGEVITKKARGRVAKDPTGEAFPWYPSDAVNADDEGPDDVNETPSLCVLLDTCDAATRAAAVEALEAVAKEHKAAAKAAGTEPFCFYYGTEGDGFCEQVRGLCRLKADKGAPQAVMLDIPDGGGFYVPAATARGKGKAAAADKESLEKLVADYTAKALPRKQLGRG